MSARRTDAELLELARRAWPLLRGGDEEVCRGAARVARRSRRSPTQRRARGFVPTLLGMGAAASLAWAAYSSLPRSAPRAPAAPILAVAPAPGAAQEGDGSARERPPTREATPAPPRATGELSRGESVARAPASTDVAAPRPSNSRGDPVRGGDAAVASRWRAVDRALASGDAPAAARALEALSGSPEPATRAKARLGLAQLALARGDCDEVRRIAVELAASDAATRERATSLVRHCVRADHDSGRD